MDGVLISLDPLDLADPELNPAPELLGARPADRVGRDQAEGDEEKIGLVDVAIVLVDDRDLGLGAVAAPELVGDQRAAGTGAQNENAIQHGFILHDEAEVESSAGSC
jgi:hypothetical protein